MAGPRLPDPRSVAVRRKRDFAAPPSPATKTTPCVECPLTCLWVRKVEADIAEETLDSERQPGARSAPRPRPLDSPLDPPYGRGTLGHTRTERLAGPPLGAGKGERHGGRSFPANHRAERAGGRSA